MRLIQFANNAVSNLDANLTISGTTLSVVSGEGARFPTLSAGQYFMATLVKSSGVMEVIKITGRSGDVFTIGQRAAEPCGGTQVASAFSAGDRIELRMTAGGLVGEIDRLDKAAILSPLNKSANYTVVADDTTSLVRVSTASGNVIITLPQIESLTEDFDILVAKVTSDTNSVSIQRSGTNTINGASSYGLSAQWGAVWLVADRSTNTWTAMAIGVPTRYVDEGTGAGSATITLTAAPISKDYVDLVIGGVPQLNSSFSLSGNTITAGGTIAAGVPWMAKYR